MDLYAPREKKNRLFDPEDGEQQKKLWKLYGIRDTFTLRIIPFIRGLKLWDYALRCGFESKKNQSDVYYTRHLSSAFLAVLFKHKVVLELHAPLNASWKGRLLRSLLLSGRIHFIVVITDALRELLEKQLHLGERSYCWIKVLPDGVDFPAFEILPSLKECQSELHLDSEKKWVGYSGHLYPGRGIELILNLAKRNSDVQFLLVGGEPEAVSALEKEISAQGISNVVITGFVPPQKLPRYLGACDALLMPYEQSVAVSGGGNTVKWMSPLKMFEYMATRRPILSSDLPVLREILNESNAMLCEVGNLESWNNALKKVLDEEGLGQKLASQAYADVQSYSWKNRAQKILNYLREEK